MSTFAVTTEAVEKVWEHPNADSLELAKLEGMDFQFVVPKGSIFPGEVCLYFPVDSLLPEYILDYLNLTGKLSGKDKNRVKTIKLRGEISQGLIIAQSDLGLLPSQTVGLNLTEKLGVTKYEPSEMISKNARTSSLPSELHVYDIEGCERYPDVVEALTDIPVLVTEKLEGSNYAAMLRRDGSFVVCTRRQQVEELPGETHTWWNVTRRQNIQAKAQTILDEFPLASYVVIRGEVIGPGIQGNYYKLDRHYVYIFDIEIDGVPLDAWQLATYNQLFEGKFVPCLSHGKSLREYLDMRGRGSVKEASTGPTFLISGDVLREGIVIRPMTEQRHHKLGRVILKQRSPEYLLKSDT